MEEKNEIKEAEIISDENSENEEQPPRKKIDFRFELALFLILGFLLGVVLKTEAVKRITIGFNDGDIQSVRQAYDFEKIKQEVAQASAAADQAAQSGSQNSANSANTPQSNQ